MPVVKMPDGALVRFPDDMPKEQIRGMIAQKYPDVAGQKTSRLPEGEQQPVDRYKGGIYGDGTGMLAKIGRAIGSSADAAQSSATFGLNDEITAGIMTGGGMIGDYSAKQRQLDEQKRQSAAENPIASTIGSIGGGLATGGTLAKGGATLMGRSVPVLSKAAPKTAQTLLAGAEGAGYGALYGAGDARQGERMQGAATGAAIGALTGAGTQMIGDKIATTLARRSANKAAPTTQDLAARSRQLYQQMEQSGVTIKQPVVDRLKQNFDLSLGSTTPDLAPTAHNVRKLADGVLQGNPTIVDLHNFSMSVNQALRDVKPKGTDHTYLLKMKTILDAAIDNMTPMQVNGGTQAVKMMREADKLWAMNRKAQVIENIMDMADVNTGQYTQSGMANTIRREFRALYKQIAKGKTKGFSKDEVALIRQIAKGGSSSTIINLFAKFAPRGVISTVLGQGAGYAIGGPVGAAAVTGGGFIAGRAADKAAVRAAQALQTSALTGNAPVMSRIAQNTGPYIAGAAAATNQTRR